MSDIQIVLKYDCNGNEYIETENYDKALIRLCEHLVYKWHSVDIDIQTEECGGCWVDNDTVTIAIKERL